MKEFKPLKDVVATSSDVMKMLSDHLEEYNTVMAETSRESIRAAHEANIRAAEFVLNA